MIWHLKCWSARTSLIPVSGGAALLCANGEVYTGCNVENAAYGVSVCAERTALVKAVSEGHRDDFVRLAVVGGGRDYCWPCGTCRQMLYEFAPGLELLVAGSDREFVKLKLGELLPHAFGRKIWMPAAEEAAVFTDHV